MKTPRPVQPTPLLPCVLLTLLGGCLRFYHLGEQSLWFDEVLTVMDASRPFHDISRTVLASPPLYHYIVRCFYLLFGKDDFWLRVPSAFFGTLTLPLAYYVLYKLWGRTAALWGTLVWTVSPFAVLYSRELRMYSLVPLEALGALYYWNRALQDNETNHWLSFSFWMLLGLYTHNWFLFFGLGLVIEGGFYAVKHRRIVRKGLYSFGALFLFYIPWLPSLVRQANTDCFGQNHVGLLHHLHRMAAAFSGMLVPHGLAWVQADFALTRSIGISLALFLFLRGLLKQGEGDNTVQRLAIAGGFLPLFFAFLGQTVYKDIALYANRYTIIVFPTFVMVLARALRPRSEPRHRWMVLATGIWIGCQLHPLLAYYRNYSKAPWKQIAHLLTQQAQPTDALCWKGVDAYDRTSLSYYLDPSLKTWDSFDGIDPNIERLFLPVHTMDALEAVQKIPPSWKMIAWADAPKETLLLLERHSGKFQ